MSQDKIKIRVDSGIADLIPEFLKRREADTLEILSSLKAGDFERIATMGHQMKGSGSAYGFEKITDLGALIEEEAEAKRPDKLPELAKELKSYLERLELIFE